MKNTVEVDRATAMVFGIILCTAGGALGFVTCLKWYPPNERLVYVVAEQRECEEAGGFYEIPWDMTTLSGGTPDVSKAQCKKIIDPTNP